MTKMEIVKKNHLPTVPFHNIYIYIYFKWVSNGRYNNENDYKVQVRCLFYLTERKLVQEN